MTDIIHDPGRGAPLAKVRKRSSATCETRKAMFDRASVGLWSWYLGTESLETYMLCARSRVDIYGVLRAKTDRV